MFTCDVDILFNSDSDCTVGELIFVAGVTIFVAGHFCRDYVAWQSTHTWQVDTFIIGFLRQFSGYVACELLLLTVATVLFSVGI